MNQKIKELTINGESYILKGSPECGMADKINGLECVIIRTQSAGVHLGYLKSMSGTVVQLLNSRRVFYWDGAASLSQMAMEGVKKPENCKFSMIVPSIILTQAIEVIPITQKANDVLFAVPEWKMEK